MGEFLDYLYSKVGGNTAKPEEEMSRLAGMAENSTPSFSITAEEFREGWKVLQKAMYGGIITPQNAIDYIYDVLPYIYRSQCKLRKLFWKIFKKEKNKSCFKNETAFVLINYILLKLYINLKLLGKKL